MSFQFECPNGHLLEGEEQDAGLTVGCPTCGIEFLIPEPVYVSTPVAEPEEFPDVTGEKVSVSKETVDFEKPPDQVHIQCPNGHVLETPRDMLNQEALCPYCSERFKLREKDSVEYKVKHEQELETSERRLGRAWLNAAIVLLVLCVFGAALILMFHDYE